MRGERAGHYLVLGAGDRVGYLLSEVSGRERVTLSRDDQGRAAHRAKTVENIVVDRRIKMPDQSLAAWEPGCCVASYAAARRSGIAANASGERMSPRLYSSTSTKSSPNSAFSRIARKRSLRPASVRAQGV